MTNKCIFFIFLLLFACSPHLTLDKQNLVQTPPAFNKKTTNNKDSLQTKWWHQFNDKKLNNIVEQILKNSLSLKQSELALMAVKKKYEQELSTLYPELNLQSKILREGKYVSNSFNSKKVYTLGNSYSLSLYASYELDLFQKLSEERKAKLHSFLQNKYEQKALTQSLIVEGISTYLQLCFLKHKKDILKRILEISKQQYKLAQLNYDYGLLDLSTLLNYQNQYKQTETEFIAIDNQIEDTAYTLSLLLANYPKPNLTTTDWTKIPLHLLNITPGLPSELLKRRPDILAQEEELASLEAEAKVARKARFPSISLTGSLGYSSTELKNLFTPENSFFSLAAGLVQPLFNAGKLKKAEEIAILNFRAKEAEYAQTVLTAFKEVESVLGLQETLLEQRKLLLDMLDSVEKQFRIAKIKYEQGNLSLLELKEAQLTYLNTYLNTEQNKLDLLTNKLNLIKALGGEW